MTLTGPATVNEAAGTLTYTVTLSNPASGPHHGALTWPAALPPRAPTSAQAPAR
ncbi:MAG: hypothetical protein IPG23_05460 [Burkholderiales bacterium]|nr:hypothetical protein [Burkholderiales bacterium]